jgi:hypothetical protein
VEKLQQKGAEKEEDSGLWGLLEESDLGVLGGRIAPCVY